MKFWGLDEGILPYPVSLQMTDLSFVCLSLFSQLVRNAQRCISKDILKEANQKKYIIVHLFFNGYSRLFLQNETRILFGFFLCSFPFSFSPVSLLKNRVIRVFIKTNIFHGNLPQAINLIHIYI